MQQRCPRCGVGFVAREPFIRVETLERAPLDHDRIDEVIADPGRHEQIGSSASTE